MAVLKFVSVKEYLNLNYCCVHASSLLKQDGLLRRFWLICNPRDSVHRINDTPASDLYFEPLTLRGCALWIAWYDKAPIRCILFSMVVRHPSNLQSGFGRLNGKVSIGFSIFVGPGVYWSPAIYRYSWGSRPSSSQVYLPKNSKSYISIVTSLCQIQNASPLKKRALLTIGKRESLGTVQLRTSTPMCYEIGRKLWHQIVTHRYGPYALYYDSWPLNVSNFFYLYSFKIDIVYRCKSTVGR